ncbi:glucosylceramidase [Chitinophagaceae bacterium LB-8]|uniref:Glucosylceramidase n=1 Tax=Paraflavisolibacter caeni TaxID=2982496 RepID=A0A9X2XWJ3_9BACT|nr:glycoside hydrolase family 30 beta sandwich domain-containing protein [Paraflavisolibacter caeni]MCU7549812.1 glucosylceramidase [Paraflavisolibacter caeni]
MKNKLLGLLLLLTSMTSACDKKDGKQDTVPGPVTPPVQVPKNDVDFWLTQSDRMVLFTKQPINMAFTSSYNSYSTIEVDTTQTYQSMDGFGYTLTGGSATLLNSLTPNVKDEILRELFATDSTYIGVSYLRISIGASDLSASSFTYDDVPAGQTDVSLQQFSIDKEKVDLIPILKKILAINPNIKILGSPWSAPTWMKTTGVFKGGSLKPEYYPVYAQYFVKYIQAMKAEGITIDAMTVQNEPMHDGNNPSMKMLDTEQADFVKNHLGPAFLAADITTKIIIWDHNADKPDYPINVLNDAAARQYVDGSAFHLYGGNVSALTQVHNAYPNKNIYFTEQWTGGPGNFGGDLKWHIQNLIIGATRNWSRNVLEWNLAADPSYLPHTSGGCSTCMGALTIGSSTYVSRNVSYYIIAHASKFVRPGSTRIGSSQTSTLLTVAFKNPEGNKVLIVLNNGSSQEKFNIQFNGKIVTSSLNSGAVGTYVW